MRSSGEPMWPCGIRDVHCLFKSGLSSRIFWVLFHGLSAQSYPTYICHPKLKHWILRLGTDDLQSGKHVTGRDAIDPDAGLCPLDAERGAQVSDGGFGGVVGAGECSIEVSVMTSLHILCARCSK